MVAVIRQIISGIGYTVAYYYIALGLSLSAILNRSKKHGGHKV